MTAPEILHEQFVNQVFGIVLIHLDFFKHHLLFTRNLLAIKERAQDQIGEHFQGERQVLVQHFGVETDHLLGGVGIHHAANGVHRARNFLGRAPLGALENHVLDKMRDAVVRGGLAARAAAVPDAYGDRADVRHRLGDDHHAVGQNFARDVSWLVHAVRNSAQTEVLPKHCGIAGYETPRGVAPRLSYW